MPTETLIVIALPLGHRYAGAVPGSAPFDCEGCRQTVLLSPSTREMMQSYPGPARILCMACGLAEAGDKPLPTVVSSGQLEEIANYFQRN